MVNNRPLLLRTCLRGQMLIIVELQQYLIMCARGGSLQFWDLERRAGADAVSSVAQAEHGSPLGSHFNTNKRL